MTPAAYLRWANKRAEELGVDFRVADDTITRMIENHQAVCGDVYLDYDVCGNLLSRPALDALKARIDSDQSVTHLFIPGVIDSLAQTSPPQAWCWRHHSGVAESRLSSWTKCLVLSPGANVLISAKS